jgi:large subunit ribosomal protein L6
MSRIGKKPIDIPTGVTVEIADNRVKVAGPKGELERTVPREMLAAVEGTQVVVKRPSESKKHKSLHGLTRTLIANMVEGVTNGFSKTLVLSGVGYRASKQGNKLVLAIGYSKPVEVEEPEGIEFEVSNPITITVKGISKELVGETAAYIRKTRDPDPYREKGVKYAGEHILRKAGKAGK